MDDVEACGTAAACSRGSPAPPQLRRLSARVTAWTARLAALPRSAPLPHRLVEQAVALGTDLAQDAATDGILVHTDAHGENVLAADREPWLVIDPKPLSGVPSYEPGPCSGTAGPRWSPATTSAGRYGPGSARWSTPSASTRTVLATRRSTARSSRRPGSSRRSTVPAASLAAGTASA